MSKMIITAGVILAVIAMIAITPEVRAYTLDATLGTSKLDILAQTTFELQNIRITDLPKDLKATEATLVTTSGGTPTITLHNTYVGFSGSLQYKTPDGSTNLASTSFVPDIKKITKGDYFKDIPYVYTLKQFMGPKGEMTLNAAGMLASKGTIHLEEISDPTTD